MFDQSQLEQLHSAYDQKKLVEVSGVNSYGEKFSTYGKLVNGYKTQKGVNSKAGILCLELDTLKLPDGVEVKPKVIYTTKYRADNRFIILKINIDGITVFENPNKSEILAKAQYCKQKTETKLAEEGKDFVVDCPVVRGLRSLIGRPVVLDNDYGVVISVQGSDLYNNPMVYLDRNTGIEHVIVVGESCLYSNNLANELTFVCENDPYQFWRDTKFDSNSKPREL